jgi:hypothetical protein
MILHQKVIYKPIYLKIRDNRLFLLGDAVKSDFHI